VKVKFNFGAQPGVTTAPGYESLEKTPVEKLVPGLARSVDKKECEVLMLIGLPLSGKTEWSKKYVADHPEKQFTVLGIDYIFQRMKIWLLPDTTDASIHRGKKEKIQRAVHRMDSFSGNLFGAVLNFVTKSPPRNYILDSTNLAPEARERKLELFEGYGKKTAIVFVVPGAKLDSRAKAVKRTIAGVSLRLGITPSQKGRFSLPEEVDVKYIEVPKLDLPEPEPEPEPEKESKDEKIKEENIISDDVANLSNPFKEAPPATESVKEEKQTTDISKNEESKEEGGEGVKKEEEEKPQEKDIVMSQDQPKDLEKSNSEDTASTTEPTKSDEATPIEAESTKVEEKSEESVKVEGKSDETTKAEETATKEDGEKEKEKEKEEEKKEEVKPKKKLFDEICLVGVTKEEALKIVEEYHSEAKKFEEEQAKSRRARGRQTRPRSGGGSGRLREPARRVVNSGGNRRNYTPYSREQPRRDDRHDNRDRRYDNRGGDRRNSDTQNKRRYSDSSSRDGSKRPRYDDYTARVVPALYPLPYPTPQYPPTYVYPYPSPVQYKPSSSSAGYYRPSSTSSQSRHSSSSSRRY